LKNFYLNALKEYDADIVVAGFTKEIGNFKTLHFTVFKIYLKMDDGSQELIGSLANYAANSLSTPPKTLEKNVGTYVKIILQA